MILTNDGSFTRNATILNNSKIDIQLCQQNQIYFHNQQIHTLNVSYNIERSVWLIQQKEKIVFATSQYLSSKNKENATLNKKQAIGSSLIINENNIHRDLTKIFLGYCQELEKYFNSIGPLWGRSYNIYIDVETTLIIHEIFSSRLPKVLINY
uniref:Uncharacterized protein n=1 Tax=Dichotomaria marginata TaxID=268567 RepID=A0A1G4NS56_9FLOR|nr:Hypothetical protein ycf21 [Dichotomaria marginata]SCW21498.1 Hypothetical protein ycf21 [Dichotomaria marginata]